MKTKTKIILATTLIAAAAILFYTAGRHKKDHRMLAEIADEGYETAPDIMFPGREYLDSRIKYGPVLPA